jgi:hypothetical protein
VSGTEEEGRGGIKCVRGMRRAEEGVYAGGEVTREI